MRGKWRSCMAHSQYICLFRFGLESTHALHSPHAPFRFPPLLIKMLLMEYFFPFSFFLFPFK